MFHRVKKKLRLFCSHKKKPLKVSNALKRKIKEELVRKTKIQPTKDQWEMILSENEYTCVIAGAGSGKSTSLVLRVVVLFHYLNVPLEEITVFSFTNEAVSDFKVKLSNILNLYGYNYSSDDLKSCIRTFHSKIFDFKTSQNSSKELFDLVEDYWGDRDFNLNSAQKNILLEVHQELYLESPYYKELIDSMGLRHANLLKRYTGYRDSLSRYICSKEEDLHFTQQVHNLHNSPFKGTPLKKVSLAPSFPGQYFFANASINNTNILYIPKLSALKKDLGAYVGASAWRVLNKKLESILMFSNKGCIVITSSEDWEFYKLSSFASRTAPNLPVKLEGDFSYSPLIESFYKSANFIHCLGLDVQQTLVKKTFYSNLNDVDSLFFKALSIFWCKFSSSLNTDNKFLLNDLFTTFSYKSLENFKSAGASMPQTLRSMTHLFIDEFQDISPEIVNWIKGVRLAQKKILNEQGSLMCIGDDWQSIYGWRGSSPSYFIDFNKHFSSGNTKNITFHDNFRSRQHLIDNAEHVLKEVTYKTKKYGKSQNDGAANALYFSLGEASVVIEKIKVILEKSTTTLVLYRGASQKGIASKFIELYGLSKTSLKTFHASKGLEADTVVLIGDCKPSIYNPFRDAVYTAAGFKQTYDQAQFDEARRLAYVGMSRAKENLIWFCDPNSKGAYLKAKSY